MSARARLVLVVGAVLAVVIVAVAAVASTQARPASGPTSGAAGSTSPSSTPLPSGAPAADPTQTLPEAADEFLATWVEDGRVVRRDQGGDTVSEGQAYGLLIALAADDEAAFGEIWAWTSTNLVRPDGLLAWQWADGEIVDDEPASDADVDAARALVLAGTRWADPALTAAGVKLAGVVADTMTVQTQLGRILVPGQWAAAADPYQYNPSYASPVAFVVLGEATGDPRWAEVAAGSAAATARILEGSALPPDWAQVHGDGTVEPMPGAAGTGQSVRYGYDAARLAVRYAESCVPGDPELAARLARPLGEGSRLAAELDLGGAALAAPEHPVAYVARAAARGSAGDSVGAAKDLASARTAARESPTYYGAAWALLGSVLLESDLLGGCPPLAGSAGHAGPGADGGSS